MPLTACVGLVGELDDGSVARDTGTDGPPIILMDSGVGSDGGDPADSSVTGDTGTGPACPAGQTLCGTTCRDTNGDVNNCGMCGRICAAGATCSGGLCTGGTGCAPAPAGSTAGAQAALTASNDARLAMGVPCVDMITEINTAAQNHCDYYAMNSGACRAGHAEVEGCAGFTGEQFFQRMSAAGYSGSAAFENMAFSNDGASAVRQWIDSVWHRTPVLSPWVRHAGYGGASGCDTMDYGRGPSTPSDVTAVWPYANQTSVPTSFDGRREGPMPPSPPTGWPSGYPITVYVNGSLSAHTITVDGSSTPIDHVWITPADSRLLSTEYVMYTHAPLTSGTTYRVHVSGSVDLEWTFTTR